MATLTATAAAAGVPDRAVAAGTNTAFVRYNSGTTAFSVSATVVLLLKVPNHCTITNIVADHTAGAATVPADYGISIGTLSTFATTVAKGAIVLKTQVLPYKVSVTSDTAPIYMTVTPTVSSTTASFMCNMSVYYNMN